MKTPGENRHSYKIKVRKIDAIKPSEEKLSW